MTPHPASRPGQESGPSGALLWVGVALGLLVLALMAVLLVLFATAPRRGGREVHAAIPPPGRLPVSAGQRHLLALTHAPRADLAREGAAAVTGNRAIPFSHAPVIAAAPFSTGADSAIGRDRAELCLTQAIYYEAGFEPPTGKRAVAQIVLNRVRHPAFPDSVCGVVYEGAGGPVCQFSFACDGALERRPVAWAWAEARAVAHAALNGHVERSVGMATHYHADYVLPRWAPQLAKIASIGTHIFYRWPGGWGLPRAFGERYSGAEVVPLFAAAPGSAGSVAIAYPPVAALPERRADDDLGGRIDVSKGWTPNIPMPSQSSDALARVYARQSVAMPGAQP